MSAEHVLGIRTNKLLVPELNNLVFDLDVKLDLGFK